MDPPTTLLISIGQLNLALKASRTKRIYRASVPGKGSYDARLFVSNTQANEQDDELRILRANVARLESNGLHKCKAQPRTVRAERSAGSIVGVLRWWKPERSLSRSSSMAGIHGDITVV